jgi:hypothetical protein
VKRALAIIAVGLAAVALVVWFAGVRVVMVRDLDATSSGYGALVRGLPGAALVDSPEAACIRREGYATLICRGILLRAMTEPSRVLVSLPYSQALHDMAIRRAARVYLATSN